MAMGRRQRAIRFVFIVGLLTTIATSAPQGFSREDGQVRSVAPLDVVRARVVFSAATSEQAESMTVAFIWNGNSPVMLVPDDLSIAPVQLEPQGFAHNINALELCIEAGPCELGFTIDAGDAASGELEVIANAGRSGDASFCFPDNRDFAGDATVQVIFE